MKTYKRECIQEIVDHLLSELEKEGLSEQTVKGYKCGFSLFQKYIDSTHVDVIDENVCLDYIETKTGKRLAGLHEPTGDPSISLLIGLLLFLFALKVGRTNIMGIFQVLWKEILAEPPLTIEKR